MWRAGGGRKSENNTIHSLFSHPYMEYWWCPWNPDFLPSSLAASFVSDQAFLTWLLQLVATVLCVCVSHDVTLNVPDRFACFNAPLLVVSPVASLSPSSFRAYFLCRAGKEQTPKNVLCYQFNNEWHFCSSSSANACGMWMCFVVSVWGDYGLGTTDIMDEHKSRLQPFCLTTVSIHRIR